MQEVSFMSNNKDALANGLLQNMGYQTHVSKLKLEQQTKVGCSAVSATLYVYKYICVRVYRESLTIVEVAHITYAQWLVFAALLWRA